MENMRMGTRVETVGWWVRIGGDLPTTLHINSDSEKGQRWRRNSHIGLIQGHNIWMTLKIKINQKKLVKINRRSRTFNKTYLKKTKKQGEAKTTWCTLEFVVKEGAGKA